MTSDLSVIIPTLDAADSLGRTLESLSGEATGPHEIIVADGGSRDATMTIAARHGATFVRAPKGRGAQLAEGARAATGKWYLFLHADTALELGWSEEARSFMLDPANETRAGCFRLGLDDPSRAARRLERIVAWRCKTLGLPYGDQGLLIGAAFYDSLGGFAGLSLMEDVDMVRRIGAARLVFFDRRAVTSAARYRRAGYIRRPARNLACLALYFLGVPTRLIARLYG